MERISELVNAEGIQELPLNQVYLLIEHACRVDQLSFKVWSILFTACAVLAATTRLLIRYLRERTLFLEDYLILFATICLICETGLVYSFIKTMYLIDATTLRLPVLGHLARAKEGSPAHGLFTDFLKTGPQVMNAYLTFGWFAVFAVKASFLALFYKMLRNVSKNLMTWFWITVTLTAMSAIIVVLEDFIICPQFGAGPAQCFVKNGYTFSISSGVVVQSLDIITDLMIVSIPILLLRLSHLHLQHKLRLSLVLCLSTTCILLSIGRLAGGISHNVFSKHQFSLTWVSFMLHCEAAVAVMAGSVPALHALFTSHHQRNRPRMVLSMGEDETIKEKAIRVLGRRRVDEEAETGLAVPGLVHERVRVVSITRWRQSFGSIMPRRTPSNRSRRLTASHHRRNDSTDSGMIHPGIAYHNFRREEKDREKKNSERRAIRVTFETTVSSHSASEKSLDIAEASSPSGTVVSAPNSPKLNKNFLMPPMPEPAMSSRGMDLFVDEQFGRIHAGLHM
ncbi:hypothetical protein CC80DRAFT_447609 [Byssothecium circinans]|uniref:Rhodopsin domain-containing protein n=1 Tax=Byssothecium circinans TaxID=147558 RepID=A0A6A5TTC4_9PLEO|nr:hypothetical protein CC80DRAFT_447609 [Byssothecium circinans]